MPRYVALLRGINVGGHRVKMDALRRHFEEIGYSSVSTFIASGNLLFETDGAEPAALEERIAEHLEDRLGFAVPTFLRTLPELEAVAKAPCFTSAEITAPETSLYVVFLAAPADAATRTAFAELESDFDRFGFAGREIYWLLQGKLSASPLFGKSHFDRATRQLPNTMRGLPTVRKLITRLSTSS